MLARSTRPQFSIFQVSIACDETIAAKISYTVTTRSLLAKASARSTIIFLLLLSSITKILFPLTIDNCQLSTVNCQLSTIHICQTR
ncbi:MAG: hypothetical protein HC849_04175 [Oscillatoriales cyanobacterium RU_3_3]|nr:hypothetical protein [Microcoleus sp. SU_5_6]NJL67274.1 hypothetical protein [Microcoleus sp. SM1_3_4]NJM59567.1 hypothetical protein [Oscillatoriales cyanobacterium RU_3_3]NJR23396.1 hypothetical protein [Richelia sp. CSU_2_1]